MDEQIQATHKLEPITNGVKCFIRSNDGDRYLFVLRDNNPQILNPNKWSLFGGGINEGEKPAMALQRKLFEEAKIIVTKLTRMGDTELKFMRDGKSKAIRLTLFHAVTVLSEGETNTALTEGQMARFFTLEEIVKMDVVPGLVELISRYKKEGLLN